MDNLIDWRWNGVRGAPFDLCGQRFVVADWVNGHTLAGAPTTVFETQCRVCGAPVRKGLTDKEMKEGAVPLFACGTHKAAPSVPLGHVLSLVDDRLTLGGREYRYVETVTTSAGREYLILRGECKTCGAATEAARREEEIAAGGFLPHHCPACRAQKAGKPPKAASAPVKVAKPKGPFVGSVMAVVLAVLEERPGLDDHAVCGLVADRLGGDQCYKRAKRALASVRKRSG